ncbi:MAG: hypothetical protein EOS76_06850 [Mesorhizobium sp.]|uniref:CBASS cGAMP synthase n=1 Tax=unclassified Mesorhizobium TaxID=325217 RepID=UPI000F75ADE2|nr:MULTISPECIES: hypothetical protein [unclassified Mesorhizobium]AZO34027.1 hypothetical protein EJ072_05535 [Mesorhizobium sp. M2A.F.Ca.ET.046.03.2.1]AZO71450.1 hypothetical protein EJ067_09885 [Mesorhizobium sp. M1D.F.Ca.ET.043.01.1.1]RWB47017.1 MAG: hypothetical protein EOQ44_07515 [Mesorhizobium sp.]RWE20804.1 MAG: hypothetical protein EOS76_06850 [Mesorhizobium sp.]
MANVSKLLHTTTDPETFLENLTLDTSDVEKLREARLYVRAFLKEWFAARSRQGLGFVIEPRFFTQGSVSYKTINYPIYVPKQQMDMDDGCYLPLNFVRGAQPSDAATLFFAFIDEALRHLAKEKGWRFVEKPTCCRLVIADDAHVDIPLYAIPDREFQTLEKAAHASADMVTKRMAAGDTALKWEDLPADSVLLAHREKDWIASDPRKIRKWFVDAVEVHGEILRRVCRYLKGWRDYNHPTLDGVSSIILMACAFEVFEEMGRRDMPTREDLALLTVVERLPKLLEGPVLNPADRSEKLDAKLDSEQREVAIAEARRLHANVREAVHHSANCQEAVAAMQEAFGDRIPNRPDLVNIAEAARAEVRSHAPKIVAAPTVGRSTSG